MVPSYFGDTWRRFPMCTNRFSDGVIRLPIEQAICRRNIELNHPWKTDFLAFDIDRSAATFAHEDAELPAPTFIMENPKNGHAHILYQLELPVIHGDNARRGPIQFLNDVSTCMTYQLQADPAYIGRFVKTPGHSFWRTTHNKSLYTLVELSEYLTVDIKTAKSATEKAKMEASLGSRNLTLFDLLSRWAYDSVAMYRKEGGFGAFKYAAATKATLLCQSTIRKSFPEKGVLSPGEQAAVVASVTRWTWGFYTGQGRLRDGDFKSKQEFRATCRWGDNSRQKAEAIRLYQNGMKIAKIAILLGRHRNTISRWVKPP